jgi:hypothetical protein
MEYGYRNYVWCHNKNKNASTDTLLPTFIYGTTIEKPTFATLYI